MTMQQGAGSDVPSLSTTMAPPASSSPEPAATPAAPETPAPASAAPEGAQATAQPGQSTQDATTGTLDWHSAQNPYRFAAEQAFQQLQQYQQQEQQRQLQAEHAQLVQRGVDPQQAAAAVEMRRQQMAMQAQAAEINRQARPIAAAQLAQKIKAAYGVDVTPEELMSSGSGAEISSVDAMLARADALVGERRKTAFTQRVQQGADTTPKSGGGVTTFDASSLKGRSPAAILALGLARMNDE